ncbi:hypothetical protein Q7P37_003210 [Cladosporium fusiforme]
MDVKSEQPIPNHRPPTSKKHLFTALSVATVIATSLYNLGSFNFDHAVQRATLQNIPTSLDTWLDSERPIALQGILDNIGASGPQAAGAKPGIVVASPSTTNPDYFYTWTRDSALTIKTLADELVTHQIPGLESTLQAYISAQAAIQGIDNPSGGLCTGGLGEAKFNVDETAFTGDWGRPQRDGPALRAIALVTYARKLLSHGLNNPVTEIIWPILQNDLSYVTQHWNETTFNLWEEVKGASFFTTAMQYRALVEGQRLARDIGKACPHCVSQAPQILCLLQSYWTGSFILSNIGDNGRSGKDINSILTSTHMFDVNAGCDSTTFQPCSDKALANHKVVTDAFRSVYAINEGIPAGVGVAVGRYPEDVYMGGNPWYLGAFAAAEMLFQAVFQWRQAEVINITAMSYDFFKDVYPSAKIGSHAATSPEFQDIIGAVTLYADTYMANAQKYTPTDGALAEQYSRNDGTPVSARDLTWSYAAFLTAYNARKGIMPASWGASSAVVPSVCSKASAQGPCSTAKNTAWPSNTPAPPCQTPTFTTLMFNVRRPTVYGQRVFLSGSVPQLGAWDTSKALPLSAGKYTEKQPVWYTFVRLPAGSTVEYKYVLKNADGSTIVWELGPNREYTVPATCAVSAAVDDEWR